jgi:phage terminase large subunit-like protein
MTSKLNLTTEDKRRLILNVSKQDFGQFRIHFSYTKFVKDYWEAVPGVTPLQWSWHLDVLADEMEIAAWRVWNDLPIDHNTIFNTVPGTSKSTVCTIMFQPWTWTFFPEARHMTGTHTEGLGLDLSKKSMFIVESDLYRARHPHVVLQSRAVGDWSNTLGGVRFVSTVAGVSPTGRHFQFIGCFPHEINIITNVGMLPIGEIVQRRMNVKVLSFDHEMNRLTWSNIEEWETTPVRGIDRLTFSDGESVEVTAEHPFYISGKGYVPVAEMNVGDEVLHVDPVRDLQKIGLQMSGALCQDETKDRVLLGGPLCSVQHWDESSQLEQHEESLRELRRRDSRVWGIEKEILFDCLSCSGFERKQEPSLSKSVWQLRTLRKRIDDSSKELESNELLQQRVRGQGTFGEDERKRKFQLVAWEGGFSKRHQGRHEDASDHQGSRLSLLHELWDDERDAVEKIRGGNECSPCGLRQEQQRPKQSDFVVQELPFEVSRKHVEAFAMGSKVVTKIERNVRIPAALYNLRVSRTHNYFAERILVHNCDDPLDPKKALSQADTETAAKYMTNVIPSRKVNKLTAWTYLVMQRLGFGDPSEVWWKESLKEGAIPIKRFVLPGELSDDVEPEELKERYVDGLLDPIRLPRSVLNGFKPNGVAFYSSQVMQNPKAAGGGCFKYHHFSQRVKAAPYQGRRVRHWDRASSDGHGCATAGTLMCKANGSYFVEHVVHGHWEPTERNKQILDAAIRDRIRYGPNNEPLIVIEEEGGSTSADARKTLANVLAGFNFFFEKPTGSKDMRAEPWSSELAAMNVYLVDNGESQGQGKADWDIDEFVEEHCRFRFGGKRTSGSLVDRVDSADGAFNYLSDRNNVGQFRVIHVQKRQQLQIAICTEEQLPVVSTDEPSILISIKNPPGCSAEASPGLPPHSCHKLVGSAILTFADVQPSEHQDHWEQPVQPWNKSPASLILTPQEARKAWQVILKKHQSPPKVIVICHDGDKSDRRAESVACAVCDQLRLERERTLWKAMEPEWKPDKKRGTASNQHAYGQMIAGRNLAVQ